MVRISERSNIHRLSVRISWVWLGLLLGWVILLCTLPDPRPLGAPEWAVGVAESIGGFSEATARLVATVALRGLGLMVIGVLLALVLRRVQLKVAGPVALILSTLLALVTQW